MLSLYVHIPFCVKKCLYCGFYSTQYDCSNADAFLRGLGLETTGHRDEFSRRIFETVYVGGGTPTTLSADRLVRLLTMLRENFRFAPDAEYTMEANPNSTSGKTLSLLREQGINRLSIGVQSFSDPVLKRLGRAHSAVQAREAVHDARTAGFENIGIDLMYGIPDQTEDQWLDTVNRAVDLCPEHISAYSLSLDEGSLLMGEAEAGRFSLPGDEVVARMYESAVERLVKAGYLRYEISNFARPGRECRHNVNYWDRGEYLGLGPGSWSFIENRRYGTIADLREYSRRLEAGQSVVGEEEFAESGQAALETLLLGLRTSAGVELRAFAESFGEEAVRALMKNLKQLRTAGLFSIEEGRLSLTSRGILLSNEALARLVA